jgi:thiamine-phosphate pyrophosphorylase
MLLYAITSRALLAGTETERAKKLVSLASGWAAGGVDSIQIREKDLSHNDLTELATRIVRAVREIGAHTKVLINADPEVAASIALESGADGIHLAGGFSRVELAGAIGRVRQAWQTTRTPAMPPVISVSCHTVAEVRAARAAGAGLALFAPVFEKVLTAEKSQSAEESQPATSSQPARIPGQGLEALAQACAAAREPSPHPELPVFALGGVNRDNAPHCLTAGAAGIAAIRLFLNEGRTRHWNQLVC